MNAYRYNTMAPYVLDHITSHEDWMRQIFSLAQEMGFFWLDGSSAHELGEWSFAGANPDAMEEGTQVDELRRIQPRLHTNLKCPEWVGFVRFDGSWQFAHYTKVFGWNHSQQKAYLFAPCRSGVRLEARPLVQSHSAKVLDLFRNLLLERDAGFFWSGKAQMPKDMQSIFEVFATQSEQKKTCLSPKGGCERGLLYALEGERDSAHVARIKQAQQRMADGLLYEVNLARKFDIRFEQLDPILIQNLWLAMRQASDVPFGFYFSGLQETIISRSMELFFRWDRNSDMLESRPIKGTAQRWTSSPHDHSEVNQLLSDEKEIAEHVMVVDLVRNDMGRIAQPGTVNVRRFRVIETYEKLHHAVSSIQCVTQKGIEMSGIFSALFPPASVTGAPKYEAVRAIHELESEPRGIYTGAIGFQSQSGDLEFSVAIRTAVIDHAHKTLKYWAGGGLVESSDPTKEVDETLLKARVLLDALAQLNSIA